LCLTLTVHAQSDDHARHQLYGGYTFLSNSLNGLSGSHQPLNGWNVSFAFPSWKDLRFKFDVSGYRGTNLGAPQQPFYVLGGGQYDIRLKKATLYVDGLAGEAGANKTWGPNNTVATSASFAAFFGGGLDIPLTRKFGFRVGGGYQYSNFALESPAPHFVPSRPPGLPNNFLRIFSGLVWKF
jgi:hypothetical protein